MEAIQINIEKGIKAPEKGESVWEELLEMEIGDSFLIPKIPHREPVNICRCIKQYGKRVGLRFVHRKTENGYRMWRIK